MKMKIVIIIIATLLVALVLAGAFSLWYIGRMSIVDKWGMVYEEPSVSESNTENNI